MNRSLVFSFFGRDVTAGRTMSRLAGTAQLTGRRFAFLDSAMVRWAKRGALAAGVAAVYAGKKILEVGMAYQDSLNIFQSVTKATKAQMEAVGATAKRLGADMKLPATSAADAASAMTELAKGGMNVKRSMQAARGTLQLATAAQIEAAEAAKIESATLGQFNLKGKDAAHVADLLAGASAAAQGEITDMANAMSYVGPVAANAGATIDDTTTAITLLARKGVLASKAGTSLRGMFTSLASPSSEKAAAGMKALGVNAYNAQGRFVGLRKVIDQLAAARKKLTPQAFAAATKDAFQGRNLAALNILAQAGVKSWDKLKRKLEDTNNVERQSEARTKGLRGAFQGLQSQLENVALSIYGKVSPGLEHFVRGIANSIPAMQRFASEWSDRIGPALHDVGNYVSTKLWPTIRDVFTTMGRAVKSLVGPLRDNKDGLKTLGKAIAIMGAIAAKVIGTEMKIWIRQTAWALRNLITVIGWVGKALKFVADHFNTLKHAAGVAVAGILKAFKYLVDKGLDFIGFFIHGAADAFGWLPGGIGDSLQNAADKFEAFRSNVDSQLSSLAASASSWGTAIGSGLGTNLFNAVAAAASAAAAIGSPKAYNVSSHVSGPGSNPVPLTAASAPAQRTPVGYVPPATVYSGGSGTYGGTGGGGSIGGSGGGSTGGGGGSLGGSSASSGPQVLKHFGIHQGRLLAAGLLNGFHGASQRLLGKLGQALQDQFGHVADMVETKLAKWGARVKAARDHMLEDIKARKSMAAEVRDSLLGGFSLTDAFTDDADGNSVLGNIGTFLAGKLSALKTFAADLSKLRKAGLSANLLSMVASAGPLQGHLLAQQILSGAAGSIGSLNTTAKSIKTAAQAAGNVVAGAAWDRKIDEDRKHYKKVEAAAQEHTKLLKALIHAVIESATTPEGMAKALRRVKRELGHDLGLA